MNWRMTWPDCKYSIILADPPWDYKTYSDKGQGRCPDYPTMKRDDIKNLPVKDIAADECVLFLWTTPQDLDFVVGEVMPSWGFTYKTTAFVWGKIKVPRSIKRINQDLSECIQADDQDGVRDAITAMFSMSKGYYTRKQTELCLIGTAENIPTRKDKGVPEMIIAPRRQHSRKPDEQYDRIEALFNGPDVNYIELFARQEWSDDWDVWGLETDAFEADEN